MIQLKRKRKFQTGVRWLALSGILIVFGAGGWLVYAQALNRGGNPVSVRLLAVERGNVEIAINESGTVELGGQQTLKSPGEVAVDRVLVDVGESIRLGQKLVILRNQERQTNLENQELEIRKQELTLVRSREKVEEASLKLAAAREELQQEERQEPASQKIKIRQQEIKLARSREKVEEASIKLATTRKKLQQLEALNEEGFIPKDELQDRKQAVRDAESALRDAQTEVSTDTLELDRLQLEVESLSELQEKVMAARTELRGAQSELDTNVRELQRLQVERESIQQQLENNVVTAPISGKVLDIKVQDGDGVKPGDALLTLGNPAQEVVQLQLSTLDAAKVKVNQQARIKVIGPDPKPYTGRVKSLYPQAIASQDNEESRRGSSSEQLKVPATVQLDQPSYALIPGSQVSVEIILERRQNVVALELGAIQRSGAESFVWIRDDWGRAQKQAVTLGLEGVTNVEVKSGLKPGEEVLLPQGETPLEPGMPVVPAPNLPTVDIQPPGQLTR